MKKYEVNEIHPYLCAGLILDQKQGPSGSAYFVGDSAIWIEASDVLEFAKNGWIKEIQEKEFTKDDMINFAKYYDKHVFNRNKAFRNWITNKENENKNKQHITSNQTI